MEGGGRVRWPKLRELRAGERERVLTRYRGSKREREIIQLDFCERQIF